MSIASRIRGWFQPKNAEEQLLFDQTKFLLSQAPLMELHPNSMNLARVRNQKIPYAYINPLTFRELTNTKVDEDDWGAKIPGSPTQWVFTPLLPQSTVIFSPNRMPGVEAWEADSAHQTA